MVPKPVQWCDNATMFAVSDSCNYLLKCCRCTIVWDVVVKFGQPRYLFLLLSMECRKTKLLDQSRGLVEQTYDSRCMEKDQHFGGINLMFWHAMSLWVKIFGVCVFVRVCMCAAWNNEQLMAICWLLAIIANNTHYKG